MASKSYTVSFNIIGNENLSAAVAKANKALGNLGKSNKAMQNAAKNLSAVQNAAKSLGNIQNAVKDYKALQNALNQSAKSLSTATGSLGTLNETHNQNLKAVERLSGEYDKLRAAQAAARLEKSTQRERLKALREEQQQMRRAFDVARRAGDLNSMRALTAQMKTQSEQVNSQNARVKAASQTYSELTDKVKAARQELSTAQSAATKSGQDLSLQRSQVQTNLSNLQQQAAALSRLKSALATAGFDVSKLAQEEARLESEINRVNNALSQQERRVQALNNFSQAQQNLSNSYSNLQNALQTADTIMTPFKSAIDNAVEFEYAMSKVKALTQMRNIKSGNISQVREEMAALESQAKELGATTEFTQTEIANAMGFYGMAGWDTSRIQAIMRSTIDLASIAGDHNIARTADVLSDDLSAMGLKAGRQMRLTSGKIVEESKYFTDAFAYAITQANLNRESLHEALKYNAPTAHASGLSLGETFAMNMVSANAGIKGSQAGTSFRQGWVRFLAPPKTAVKALQEMSKEMGVVMEQSEAMKATMESQATLRSIGVDENASLFDKITKAYEFYQSLDESQRAGWLKGLVGQSALSAWQIAFDKGNIEEVARIAQEIQSGYVEGWAEQTAGVMRDNTKTRLELLNSSVDALSESVGSAFLPMINEGAQTLTVLVGRVNEFVQQNRTAVQAVGLLAAAISTAIVSVAGFSLAMAGIRFAQTGLQAAGALFGGLSTKIGAVTAALRGLTLTNIGAWWAGLNASFMAMLSAPFSALATKITAIATALRGLTLAGIGSGISSGISAAVGMFSQLGSAIMIAARAAFAFAFSPVGAALMAIALAGLYAYQNWERVAPALSALANTFTSILMPAFDAVKTSLQVFFSTLGQAFDGAAFEQLAQVFSNLKDAVGSGLVAAFITLAGVVGSVLAGIVTGLAGLVTTIADLGTGLTEAFYKLTEGDFRGAFSSLAEAGTNAAENFKNSFADAFSAVKTGIEGTSAALETYMHPDISVGQFRMADEAATVANAIDTSVVQEELNATGTAAQDAAAGLQIVNESTQNISQVGESLSNVTTGIDTAVQATSQVGESLSNVTTSIDTAVQATSQVGESLNNVSINMQDATVNMQTSSQDMMTAGENAQNSGLMFQDAGVTAQNSIVGFQSMADAAGAVAGALSAKAAEIGSIRIPQPQLQVTYLHATVGGNPKEHNAKGGIYSRGAFTTWFAESSPEAAIPIDGSDRAKSLWLQTGSMLGLLDTPQPIAFNEPVNNQSDYSNVTININVNVSGQGDATSIRQAIEDSLPEIKSSLAEQLAYLNHERARRSYA